MRPDNIECLMTRAARADEKRLKDTLNRISRPFGSWFERDEEGSLVLHAGSESTAAAQKGIEDATK
jgi:hypothetical protein